MKLEKLQNAVAYAVENHYGYIVQTNFVREEYMCEKKAEPYNVDTALNCEYTFFVSEEEAEKFRRTNIQSLIVGNHQTVINVQAYLDFYEQQEPIDPAVEKMILLRNKKDRE